MKFGDLKAGDVMTLAGTRSVLLAVQKPHPLNPRFNLYIWWIFDQNRMSFDMLDPAYELIGGSHVYQDGLVSFRDAIKEATS